MWSGSSSSARRPNGFPAARRVPSPRAARRHGRSSREWIRRYQLVFLVHFVRFEMRRARTSSWLAFLRWVGIIFVFVHIFFCCCCLAAPTPNSQLPLITYALPSLSTHDICTRFSQRNSFFFFPFLNGASEQGSSVACPCLHHLQEWCLLSR